MNTTVDQAQVRAYAEVETEVEEETQDLGEVWSAALAILKERVPEGSYRTWLQNAQLSEVQSKEKGKVQCSAQGRAQGRGSTMAVAVVSVPSAFAAQWLQQRYTRAIADALKMCIGRPVCVSFRVDHARSHRVVRALDGMPPLLSPVAQKTPTDAQQPAVAAVAAVPALAVGQSRSISLMAGVPQVRNANTHPAGSPPVRTEERLHAECADRSPLPALSPRYTFDRFLVGRSNQLGASAARRVADDPGAAYNPLFIYGFHGVGKTHLLHAIGNDAYSRRGSRVLCAPATLFENQAVASRLASLVGTDALNHIDLLLVDDLHNISGAGGRTAQRWLATLVEGLLAAGKGVAVTAAHPPGAMLALQDGLLSIFREGSVIAVDLPDVEVRLRMARYLAQQSGKLIDQSALELLASRCTTMAQLRALWEEVEVVAGSLLDASPREGDGNDRPLSLQDVQAALAKSGPPTMLRYGVGPERIIDQVASYFDLEPSEMCSSSRERRVMVPRQIAMYLIREQTDCSYGWIAHRFARRDHTTAMHSCGRVQELSETNLEVRQVLLELRQMIFGEHERGRSLRSAS